MPNAHARLDTFALHTVAVDHPPLRVDVDRSRDLDACGRDLERVAAAIRVHRPLLTALAAEDARAVDAARQHAADLLAEVDLTVPPATGWAHAVARHHEISAVRTTLGRHVESAVTAARTRMAQRVLELVPNLEALRLADLATIDWAHALAPTA